VFDPYWESAGKNNVYYRYDPLLLLFIDSANIDTQEDQFTTVLTLSQECPISLYRFLFVPEREIRASNNLPEQRDTIETVSDKELRGEECEHSLNCVI